MQAAAVRGDCLSVLISTDLEFVFGLHLLYSHRCPPNRNNSQLLLSPPIAHTAIKQDPVINFDSPSPIRKLSSSQMDSPPEDYSRGFAGPVGRVDYTSVGDGSTQVEAQELKARLVNYIHQRRSAGPAAGDIAAVNVAQKFVKFHQGNEVWGEFAGKSSIKRYLIGTSVSGPWIRERR
jgi:hypothetical protein